MGRDTNSLFNGSKETTFQPTRPHGARLRAKARTPYQGCFNPRARMGRDIHGFSTQMSRNIVSTHAPAWGATHLNEYYYKSYMFQPTRPHGARQTSVLTGEIGVPVSTHAPAWGATYYLCHLLGGKQFQPTRPHGARLLEPNVDWYLFCVSTHAPAWGAT